jgi:dephospho-CoA kinase
MLLVGLTGNYGMGKSTVLPMFENLGAITLDTDKIVISLLNEKNVRENIRGLLGDAVLNNDGTVNRRRVADVIFKDNILRYSIEDILHPLVFEKIAEFLEKLNRKEKVIIIEIPLLYERGYEDKFDKTITIVTDKETALYRLEENGIPREDALLRLQSQLPIEEKIKQSDFVINNNNSIEDTMKQVEMIYQKLLQEAGYGDNQRSRKTK